MKPKVFIIVLNWNGKKDTIECLETLWNMEHETWNMEIVVVDNGSTDGSVEAIKSFALLAKDHLRGMRSTPRTVEELPVQNFSLKLIENRTNLGYAEGNNIGIRYALENGADYVTLLNNDTLVDKNLVTELLKVMEKNEEIGITGPKIYFAPGFEYHHDRYSDKERGKVIWYAGGIIDWQNVYASHRGVDEVDRGQYDKMEETDFVSGCAIMVEREVFEKIGLLDNKYYLYYEDNDFCQRALRAGFKVVYAPKATLWHKNAGSGGGVGSNLQDYYTTRNRFLFGLRYAPWKAKLVLITESMRLLLNGRIWQKKGIIDLYLRRLGKGSYQI